MGAKEGSKGRRGERKREEEVSRTEEDKRHLERRVTIKTVVLVILALNGESRGLKDRSQAGQQRGASERWRFFHHVDLKTKINLCPTDISIPQLGNPKRENVFSSHQYCQSCIGSF